MKRDFTYVDDILDGIEVVLGNTDIEAGEIFNIGRGEQVALMDFINEIEKNTGKDAIKNLAPKHPADTLETWSDTTKLQALGYEPKVSIAEGVERFYEWYKTYNGIE
jgi:UDP-glucuronate 4-epimerase